MRSEHRAKALLLLISDVAALYASLFLMLLFRYYSDFSNPIVRSHYLPFSIDFTIWIMVFFIAGLYDLRILRNDIQVLRIFATAIVASTFLSVIFFYSAPFAPITPKTNLLIFAVIFTIIELPLRRFLISRISVKESLIGMILVDDNAVSQRIIDALKFNPQLGYKIEKVLTGTVFPSDIAAATEETGASLIVVPHHILSQNQIKTELYRLLSSGIAVYTLADFCELVFQFIPLNDIDENWFIEHSVGESKFYDRLKRIFELVFSLTLLIILLPIGIIIALGIVLTSSGPALFIQPRTGLNWKAFQIVKFRTMRHNSTGPNWTLKNDSRITSFGKILRYTHLDELPQLANVVKGEVSFVGPRPEIPELADLYDREVPYYHIRQLVPPGITGWAQINYKPSSSVEDAATKFEYDLYYLKNRSWILDLAIIFRTIKNVFTTPINV